MLISRKSGYQEIIVWGLKSKRHSHRFIHQGFFDNFLGYAESVFWLDDSSGNNLTPFKRRLILASGMASKNLPILPNTDYILHNVHLTPHQQFATEILNSKILKLQVYTNSAQGAAISSIPYVKFDIEASTLYQPWGTPLPESEWHREIEKSAGNIEYWVGSIWNNKAGQGNIQTVEMYRKALERNGIKFKRIGGSRINRSGMTESKAAGFLRKSPIGATIVGNWQEENGYVPCRLFKNIAAGIPPNSNADFRKILGSDLLFSSDVTELVDMVRTESLVEKQNRLLAAQQLITEYTYTAAINRILISLQMLQN